MNLLIPEILAGTAGILSGVLSIVAFVSIYRHRKDEALGTGPEDLQPSKAFIEMLNQGYYYRAIAQQIAQQKRHEKTWEIETSHLARTRTLELTRLFAEQFQGCIDARVLLSAHKDSRDPEDLRLAVYEALAKLPGGGVHSLTETLHADKAKEKDT